jgi:hypothetical protein
MEIKKKGQIHQGFYIKYSVVIAPKYKIARMVVSMPTQKRGKNRGRKMSPIITTQLISTANRAVLMWPMDAYEKMGPAL